MKQKCLKVCGISLAITLVVIVVYITIRPHTMGNIQCKFSRPVSNSNMFSFSAEAGDKIKISFSSKIEEGTLDIYLYDSAGNIIHELDYAKKLEEYITLKEDGEYTLKAVYQDLVGRFKLVVYDTK